MRPHKRPPGLLTDMFLAKPHLGVVAKPATYGRLPARDLTHKRSGGVGQGEGLCDNLPRLTVEVIPAYHRLKHGNRKLIDMLP